MRDREAWAKEQSGEADFNHSERDLWNNAEFQKSTEFPPQRSIVAQSILLDQFLVAGAQRQSGFHWHAGHHDCTTYWQKISFPIQKLTKLKYLHLHITQSSYKLVNQQKDQPCPITHHHLLTRKFSSRVFKKHPPSGKLHLIEEMQQDVLLNMNRMRLWLLNHLAHLQEQKKSKDFGKS